MKMTKMPSQADLIALLDYNPASGKLTWKVRPDTAFKTVAASLTWNKRFAGKEAFTAKRNDGYFGGCINYINLLAHRVIFKIIHGYDPDQVDHDDRDRSNNRQSNLFDAGAKANSQNTKKYSNNTSGHTGVHWDKSRNRWAATIMVDDTSIHLGRFINKADAISARKAAETLHNFHPNHGT